MYSSDRCVLTVLRRKRSLEEYDDDYKPLSKRLHSMYLKDGPAAGENVSTDSNGYRVSTNRLQRSNDIIVITSVKSVRCVAMCG